MQNKIKTLLELAGIGAFIFTGIKTSGYIYWNMIENAQTRARERATTLMYDARYNPHTPEELKAIKAEIAAQVKLDEEYQRLKK
jgi:hypothetical protein